MSIRFYQPQDFLRWEDFVKQTPAATLYHRIGWKEVVEKTFGHKGYYWIAEDSSGHIKGILPLIHLKSTLFGSFMVSLPYFNYGGVCAEDHTTRDSLISAAIQFAKQEKVEHVEFRHQSLVISDLPLKMSKVSMRITLPSDPTELWKMLDGKVRNQIRRPAKEGMIARVGKAEELDGFYEVFSKNMRDLGTPVYSKVFFKNIFEVFPDSTFIATVYKENVPLASGVLVGFRETLEIPWASSLAEFNHFGINMLLYWTALKFSCENGFKVFDFGRATPGEGTYRFKEQWGGKPVPLYWYYWTKKPGSLPDLSPKNPKYRMAIALWKRLPVSLTRFIGPSIVRNLP